MTTDVQEFDSGLPIDKHNASGVLASLVKSLRTAVGLLTDDD